MRTGIAPDGDALGDALGGGMAEAVSGGTSFLDEADREAIAACIMDVDEVGADAAAPAPEVAAMNGMAGMDHPAMPEGRGRARGGGQRGGGTMAGMDHSAMAGMAPATGAPALADGSVEGVQATAGVEQPPPSLRPRARPARAAPWPGASTARPGTAWAAPARRFGRRCKPGAVAQP